MAFGFPELNEAPVLYQVLQEEFTLLIYSGVSLRWADLFPLVPIITAG